MVTSRRFLPSTSLLIAFEAAARAESITVAAGELNLTQSAVSRQIKALEAQIGAELFTREKQTVRLTSAGRIYADQIREALHKIGVASLNANAPSAGGTLNLAVLPTFGARWLAPRLPKFLNINPSVSVNLAARLARFDFQVEKFDAAILVGNTNWPGVKVTKLMEETIIAVCNPSLKERVGIQSPEDLKRAPLLNMSTRPGAWDRWFNINGVAGSGYQGMVFDQVSAISQAAIAGVGVALLPSILIQDELAKGDLVPAIDAVVKSDAGYYLAWPAERTYYPPLVAFRDWILSEAQDIRPSAPTTPLTSGN